MLSLRLRHAFVHARAALCDISLELVAPESQVTNETDSHTFLKTFAVQYQRGLTLGWLPSAREALRLYKSVSASGQAQHC